MRDYSLLCRMIVSITIAFFRCIVNSKMWCSVWEDVVRAQICAIQSLYMFITIIPTVSPNNQTVFVLLTVTMDYQRMLVVKLRALSGVLFTHILSILIINSKL